jgi:hypothetical protein
MSFFNGKDAPEKGYTVEELQADAAKKVSILRAMAAEFINDDDNEPLTTNEMRIASRTPVLYLEKSAVVCEAVPDLSGAPANAAEILRLAHAAEVAYAPVIAEAEALARQARLAVLRKKLFAVTIARVIDKIARVFVQTGSGNWLKTHVDQMKRALTPRPRQKPDVEDEETPATERK